VVNLVAFELSDYFESELCQSLVRFLVEIGNL